MKKQTFKNRNEKSKLLKTEIKKAYFYNLK